MHESGKVQALQGARRIEVPCGPQSRSPPPPLTAEDQVWRVARFVGCRCSNVL